MCSDSIDQNAEDRLIHSLLQDDPLPESAVVVLMRLARRPDVDYANVAESLAPGAFNYLRDSDAESLAFGNTTVAAINQKIADQKLFFRRLAHLLPELLRNYNFDRPSEILSALMVIDDCHHDFIYIKNAPRQDKARRFALQNMRDATRTARP